MRSVLFAVHLAVLLAVQLYCLLYSCPYSAFAAMAIGLLAHR